MGTICSLFLSLSLSLSICGVDLADQGSRARYRAIQVLSWDSLSQQRRIQKVSTPTRFFIFHAVLDDEGRENPNTTKAGRCRHASETTFDGLGSSREHWCEKSLHFRGIAMGLYRGGGGRGAPCPQSSLDLHMHEDYAFLCVCWNLVCLSISLPISLSVYLSLYVYVCMSLFLPLSLSAYVV